MFKLPALIAVFLLCAAELRAQLKVDILNVGQGDAIYVQFPNGTNALIDGGPNGTVTSKYLKERGVTRIDRVVLTHPHSDHYRGLKKVFADFEVGAFYDTKAENRDAVGDNNLRELAAVEPGCKTYFPSPDANLDWDSKVTVKVLNTCDEPVIIHDNDETNACSLVLRFYYNGNGILLMGDANAEVEDTMMRRYKSGLNSTILKVGHHGSRTSTSEAFLARVRPQYAFISVGLNNVYGHPHKETLDRLYAAGAKVYMTTSGTQSFMIPAPEKSDALKPELVLQQPDITPEPKAEDKPLVLQQPEQQVFDPVSLDNIFNPSR